MTAYLLRIDLSAGLVAGIAKPGCEQPRSCCVIESGVGARKCVRYNFGLKLQAKWLRVDGLGHDGNVGDEPHG